MKGGCTCGSVRYELTDAPLIVHCCHCTWCQRETGSAFAVNAVIETSKVKVHSGQPEAVVTPSNSGSGQTILRCPTCHVALWSHYRGGGFKAAFVRVGTMDAGHTIDPDIHIYTSTKRPWVELPEHARAVPEFYSPADVWPAASRRRWAEMMGG